MNQQQNQSAKWMYAQRKAVPIPVIKVLVTAFFLIAADDRRPAVVSAETPPGDGCCVLAGASRS